MAGFQFLGFICIGSLVAATGLRQFFLDPADGTASNAIWFIVQVLPLLLLLPGYVALKLRATFLLCLASLLYFVHGVMLAFDATLAWLGWIEIGCALALTAVTAVMVRRMREDGAEAELGD